MSGQQFVQDHSERVDVGRGRYQVALYLLGARVFGSHQPDGRGCCFDCLAGDKRIEQLRDSEVEQLWNAIFSDQDIARLDVAMNYEVLVRVVDRGAYLLKQLEPL